MDKAETLTKAKQKELRDTLFLKTLDLPENIYNSGREQVKVGSHGAPS